jgi:signal peptidase I
VRDAGFDPIAYPRPRRASVVWKIAGNVVALAAAVLAVAFLSYTKRYEVPSASMEPTLRTGDLFRADIHFAPKQDPKRGEIWVFTSPEPENGTTDMVKRVIGLPGETVAVKGGKVLINGKPLDEPYITEPPMYDTKPTKLDSDEYWMLGDNRNNSSDSSEWGPLQRHAFSGRAMWLEAFPFRVGPLK